MVRTAYLLSFLCIPFVAAAGQFRLTSPQFAAGGAIPGGESLDSFVARLLRGLNEALTYPAPVLVVGHGGHRGIRGRSLRRL